MREFSSLAAFGEFMSLTPIKVLAEMKAGLELCATHIQEEAKKEIGKYQPEVGPFPEWAELADSTEEEKSRLGYPADAPLLRTGGLQSSVVKEVEILEAVIGSKLPEAEYQEFGTEKIPPRPFMGPALFKSRDFILRVIGAYAAAGIAGGGRVHPSLGYDKNSD